LEAVVQKVGRRVEVKQDLRKARKVTGQELKDLLATQKGKKVKNKVEGGMVRQRERI